MTGAEVMHVPYKSSGEARTAVLAGEVAYMFDSVATMAPHIRDGKVHAMATTGSKRSLILPDLPTLDEAGLKGYRATILVGLVAPKGTPAAITEKLNKEVRDILDSQEIRSSWAKQGVEPLIMNTGEFQNYLSREVDKYTKIVKDAKIPSL
jgi:tripartite-type tricarboxylate transporter receptor subunit TctC